MKVFFYLLQFPKYTYKLRRSFKCIKKVEHAGKYFQTNAGLYGKLVSQNIIFHNLWGLKTSKTQTLKELLKIFYLKGEERNWLSIINAILMFLVIIIKCESFILNSRAFQPRLA